MAGTETTDGASFWVDSTDTHKADAGYYERAASALRQLVVPRLTSNARLLDFGCGNGEYTRLLATHCREAIGIDVSAPLIDEARSSTPAGENVRWAVDERPPVGETFDVVACMGVLVCVLADTQFRQLLEHLAQCVAPGGTMVLRETLSWGEPQLVEHADYVSLYRTPLDYLQPLANAGIQLVHDEHLVTWSSDAERSNHLWLLERPA